MGVTGAMMAFVPAIAHAESRVGNGGDAMAAEFVSVADETVELLATLGSTDAQGFPPGFDLVRFRKAVATSKVFTSEKTFLEGGTEVDALNYPDEGRIVLSRSRWKGVGYDLKTVRLLVIHEYLGLSRHDDSSYAISSYLVRKINNGGSRGELWPLKDIDDTRYTNPFYGAFFEGTFDAFRPLAGEGGTVYWQNGKKISESSVDFAKAHCIIENTVPSLPTSNATLKFAIFGAEESPGDSAAVKIELKKSFIGSFVCSRGRGGRDAQKTTVKDALDALGSGLFLYHFGAAQVGNVQCRKD